jgi:RsiW-degrading membrane proteinase PrsW (M82 family)
VSALANAYLASRRSRYVAAAIVCGLVIAMLAASSAVDYRLVRSIPARLAVFGLGATLVAAVATYLGVRAIDKDPSERRRHLIRAATLLGLAALFWLLILDSFVFTHEAGAGAIAVFTLACLPTTAFGLWVVRRLDRYEPEPWGLILLAAGWGAIVATSLVVWGESTWEDASFRFLVPGPGLDASIAFSAGLFEELAKGVAVLLLFLVMRNAFDDVVDGIVYGAAVGLGFNFLESISYMALLYSDFGPAEGAYAAGAQWYARQVLGLFFGHATYTALIGAGIGIARQLADRRRAILAILSGWVVAIAAHFAWDAWLTFFPVSRTPLALVEVHLRTIVMDGPFTAAVAALLVMGIVREGLALRQELEREAETGAGAVMPEEVGILINPWRRLATRWDVFSRFGFRSYRHLYRLQRAQLALAMERWHRQRQEIDSPPDAEQELRARVIALRSAR